MIIGSGLKQRHVDKYLPLFSTQLLPGETIKGMLRVRNIRPNLTALAVTEVRIMLLHGALRYFGHIGFYDLNRWAYDARKLSFAVVLNDESGLTFKGIAAADGVFLTDFLVNAKEIPRDDARFVALARRDQRTDIDSSE